MDDNLEIILNVNTGYARKVQSDWKVDLFACYQCGKCSNGCPVTFAMDYLPHQVIRMLQLGLTEELLKSRAIWVCASCETCYARCPNEIEISKLMDALKHEVLKKGKKPSENQIAEFHKVFMKNIEMFGRINETVLMTVYLMKSSWFDLKRIKIDFPEIFKYMGLGLSMLRRGRLSLFPRWKGRKEVRKYFKES
jgi:heterodisulfide reductase subunit C